VSVFIWYCFMYSIWYVIWLPSVLGRLSICKKDMKMLDLSESVKFLDPEQFKEYNALKFVGISQPIRSLGEKNLYNLIISSKCSYFFFNSSFEQCLFFNWFSLKYVMLPSSVHERVKYSFGACSSLLNSFFPYSIHQIPWWRFFDCSSLVSIHLPAPLTTFGNECLKDYIYLFFSLVFHLDSKSIEWSSFERCDSLISILF
jgi:hypothetical protein